ncbi:hypothetical protein BDY21DRAFT_341483, partial [Lineolata rhizophorae]
MPEQRNIIVLGASYAGLGSMHYIMKHTMPALAATTDGKDITYHAYIVSPSRDFMARPAAPRYIADKDLLGGYGKLFKPLSGALEQYPKDSYTIVQGSATAWDPTARIVTVTPTAPDAGAGGEQVL